MEVVVAVRMVLQESLTLEADSRNNGRGDDTGAEDLFQFSNRHGWGLAAVVMVRLGVWGGVIMLLWLLWLLMLDSSFHMVCGSV